ncbi:MAG: DUF929 family protein [Acidimicrobiales bacterium]
MADKTKVPGEGSGNKLWWLVGGLVVLVGIALVAAAVANKKDTSDVPTGTDAQAVVDRATSVPQSVADQVGTGSVQAKPTKVDGEPLTKDGKPEVFYLGAEYCPYCATQRWAIIEALSRFGTFSDVGLTSSATADVFPDTPTVSFHGSSYSSPYIAFSPVETNTREPDGNGGYTTLDTPTAAQAALVQKYDEGGGIPFLDVANQYVFSGVTYDPKTLEGMTAAEIADAMHDPKSDVAKGAIGSANIITATICAATDNKPAKVCDTPAVRAAAAGLPTS